MGLEMKRHAMTSIGWWVVDVVSRALEPDERTAVRGDLSETRATSGQALLDVLGLVVRRHTELWMDWKPWLALAGIVVPLGLLLGHLSNAWADGHAIYAWLYVNNWTWGFLDSPGARRDLLYTTMRFVLNGVTLVGWSWSAGFVLGSLSRRTSWVTVSLFCLAALGGALADDASNPNNPTSSSTFYSLIWPVLLPTLVVVVPSLAGLRRAHRAAALPLLHAIVWAVAVTLLTTRSAFSPGAGQLGFVALVLIWPVGYMVGAAGRHRWREPTASP
jgi:hypothetical protein